jgi:phosphohistidine phosphatase SixA
MKLLPYSRYQRWIACLSLFAASFICLLLSVGSGAVAASSTSSDDDFKATTVFLVRHAEKAATPAEDPPLLEAGSARSQELARILGKAEIKVIYTSQFLRTKLTAEPLAKLLGVASTTMPLKMSASNPREVSQQSINEIVEKIYQRAGENALIVGHSNSIPEVIRALGGDVVPKIDEKEFNDLFIVTVYAKGKAKVTHLKY